MKYIIIITILFFACTTSVAPLNVDNSKESDIYETKVMHSIGADSLVSILRNKYSCFEVDTLSSLFKIRIGDDFEIPLGREDSVLLDSLKGDLIIVNNSTVYARRSDVLIVSADCQSAWHLECSFVLGGELLIGKNSMIKLVERAEQPKNMNELFILLSPSNVGSSAIRSIKKDYIPFSLDTISTKSNLEGDSLVINSEFIHGKSMLSERHVIDIDSKKFIVPSGLEDFWFGSPLVSYIQMKKIR